MELIDNSLTDGIDFVAMIPRNRIAHVGWARRSGVFAEPG